MRRCRRTFPPKAVRSEEVPPPRWTTCRSERRPDRLNGFRPAGRNPFLPLSESEYCRSSGGHSERCGRRRMQPVEARDVRILVFVSAAMSGRPFPPFRFRSACLPTFGSSSVFGAVESSAGRSPSVSTGGDGTKENVLRSVRMQDVCRNVRNAYFAAFFLS